MQPDPLKFSLSSSKNDSSNGSVLRYPLPRALFRRFSFETHLDALRTFSQHFHGSRLGCQNHSIQSPLLSCLTGVQWKPPPRLDNPVTIFLSCPFACELSDVPRTDDTTVQQVREKLRIAACTGVKSACHSCQLHLIVLFVCLRMLIFYESY